MPASAAFEEVPFDVARTTLLQRMGRHDPTASRAEGLLRKTYLDQNGEPTRHTLERRDGRLIVTTEGPSAQAGLAHWHGQFPVADGLDDFAPDSRVVRRLLVALPGLRLVRVPWLFDVAAGAVLQQRVTFGEAARGFGRIARTLGTSGPLGIAFPDARTLARTPPHAIQRLGVDPKRARALRALAAEEARTGFLSRPGDHSSLRQRLLRIPGVGAWTTEMILGFGAGDTDAVPVGDVHLPSLVTSALAGEPRGTDERMLELLEPFRGQRFRVVRLLMAAKSAPRPRLARG